MRAYTLRCLTVDYDPQPPTVRAVYLLDYVEGAPEATQWQPLTMLEPALRASVEDALPYSLSKYPKRTAAASMS